MPCWSEFASGKASIGRKAPIRAMRSYLEALGFDREFVSQWLTDCIVVLRTEQAAKRGW